LDGPRSVDQTEAPAAQAAASGIFEQAEIRTRGFLLLRKGRVIGESV
jgi:hypothetical protein